MLELIPRVLIDTNVWISALINPLGAPARILSALESGRFVPVVSRAMLRELEDVARRPRIRRRSGLGESELDAFLARLRDRSVEVVPSGLLRLCRDRNDDIVLETAIVGEARYLVSRDDDIKRDLDLIRYLQANGVEVLSVARFLELLAS